MRKAARMLAVVVAVVGAGYFALVAVAQEQLRREIDELLRQLPPGFTASYDAIDVSPVSRRVTAMGFTLKNAAQQFELTARSIEIEDIDSGFVAGWTRALANPAAFGPTTALAVAGTINARDVAYRFGDSRAKWSLATVEDLDVYPGVLLAPRAAANPGTAPDLAALADALRAQAVQALSIGFRRFAAYGIATAAQGIAMPGGGMGAVTAEVERVTMEDYSPGRLASATFAGLSINVPGSGAGTLESLEFADIDMQAPLRRLFAGEALSVGTYNGFSLGRLDYAGMSYQPEAGAGGSLDRLTIANLSFADNVRASIALTMQRLRPETPALVGLGADPAMLGIDEAEIDFGFDFAWDLAARRVSLRGSEFDLRGLGRFELSFELVDAVAPDLDPRTTKLEAARLRYVDASLVERTLNLLGMTADELAAAVRDNGRALGNSPAAAAAVAAVVEFVRAPRSLTIELRPARPTELARLRDAQPNAYVGATGLRIIANQ